MNYQAMVTVCMEIPDNVHKVVNDRLVVMAIRRSDNVVVAASVVPRSLEGEKLVELRSKFRFQDYELVHCTMQVISLVGNVVSKDDVDKINEAKKEYSANGNGGGYAN